MRVTINFIISAIVSNRLTKFYRFFVYTDKPQLLWLLEVHHNYMFYLYMYMYIHVYIIVHVYMYIHLN